MLAPIHQPVLYRCPFCYFQTILENSMLEHFVFHSTKSVHQCPLCSFSICTPSDLQLHIQRHHLLEDLAGIHSPSVIKAANCSTGGKTALSRPAIFRCGQCDYVAKARQDLNGHLLHHTVKFPFQCQVCSYSVRSANILSRHVNHHHSGRLQTDSAPIMQEVKTIGPLFPPTGKVHLKLVKFKNWNVECYQGPSGSRDGIRYQAPRPSDSVYRQLTADKAMSKQTKRYTQDILKKSNAQNVAVSKHLTAMLKKEPAGSKRITFECSDCDYCTQYWNAMKRHKIAHEREEEFKCDRCSFSSSSQNIIAGHLSRYHLKLKPAISERTREDQIQRVESMKKKVSAAEKKLKQLLTQKVAVKEKIEDLERRKVGAERALRKLMDENQNSSNQLSLKEENMQRLKEKIEKRVEKLKNLNLGERQLDVEVMKAEVTLLEATQELQLLESVKLEV